jgi:hypothetical protein
MFSLRSRTSVVEARSLARGQRRSIRSNRYGRLNFSARRWPRPGLLPESRRSVTKSGWAFGCWPTRAVAPMARRFPLAGSPLGADACAARARKSAGARSLRRRSSGLAPAFDEAEQNVRRSCGRLIGAAVRIDDGSRRGVMRRNARRPILLREDLWRQRTDKLRSWRKTRLRTMIEVAGVNRSRICTPPCVGFACRWHRGLAPNYPCPAPLGAAGPARVDRIAEEVSSPFVAWPLPDRSAAERCGWVCL